MSQESKKSLKLAGSLFAFIGVVFSLFSFTPLYFGWGTSPSWIILVVGVVAIGLGLYLFLYKGEYSEQEILEAQQAYDKFWEKWYIRYIGAIFMLVLAFVSYKMWAGGFKAQGILLLIINPIFSIVASVIAIINAWEISLLLIFLGAIYFAYIGLAALPISIAIIVGFSILAYAVYHKKA